MTSIDQSNGHPSFAIVAAVNDEIVLKRNLAHSPMVVSGTAPLLTYRNQPSAAIAYNQGLSDTQSDYVIFAHQDVYLPKTWTQKLTKTINHLNKHDPDWAVLGAFGLNQSGRPVGRLWSSGSGREMGEPLSEPVPVVTMDELVIVLRRASTISFDKNLPNFHLYGTDIVLSAQANGRTSYAADLPVVHNSTPVLSLWGGYEKSYRYMQKKWGDKLPLETLIVPVEQNISRLRIAQFKLFLSRKKRLDRRVPNSTDPVSLARKLGYEV